MDRPRLSAPSNSSDGWTQACLLISHHGSVVCFSSGAWSSAGLTMLFSFQVAWCGNVPNSSYLTSSCKFPSNSIMIILPTVFSFATKWGSVWALTTWQSPAVPPHFFLDQFPVAKACEMVYVNLYIWKCCGSLEVKMWTIYCNSNVSSLIHNQGHFVACFPPLFCITVHFWIKVWMQMYM